MFVRGSNPIWLVADLTGHLVDDSFWMFVLENEIPYIPTPVYHDPDTIANPWTNPINFLANGTLPVDIYWDPGTADVPKVYRIEIRQGNTQADPLIYLIENYVPGEGGGSITPTDIGFTTENQITNPQFAVVNFVSPYTFSSSVSADIQIGPGWVLSLTSSGSGSAELTQVPLNSSALTKNSSNASYALRLVLSGWSDVKLKQRFDQNGMLWANQYVSSNITARSDDANAIISARIVDSMGNVLGQVLDSTPVGGLFAEYPDVDQLDNTINTNIPPTAWIEYQLQLQNNIDIYITSIQLIVSDFQISPVYEQDSIERQIDHTFHYYEPQLAFKPITSLLTGWDFKLNPAQFGTAQTVTNSAAAYVWDQLICLSKLGTIAVDRSPRPEGISFTTSQPKEAFYTMQYLSGLQVSLIKASNLAVNIDGYSLSGSGVIATVSLFVAQQAGTIPILPSTIGTLNADGTFSLTDSNWTKIPMINGYSSSKTIENGGPGFDTGFIGFDGLSQYALSITTQLFCMVVSYYVPTSGTTVYLNSTSLVPGDIPTRPAPSTYGDVVRECRYYYEKSWAPAVAIGTATYVDAVTLSMAPMSRIQLAAAAVMSLTYYFNQHGFGVPFKEHKRRAPIFTFYSAINASTTGVVTAYLAWIYTDNTPAHTQTPGTTTTDTTVASSWVLLANGREGISYQVIPANLADMIIDGPTQTVVTNSLYYASGSMSFHYTADARLGII